MRFLRIFFSTLLKIFVVVFIAALLAREGLLFWGANQIKQSLTILRRVSVQRDYVELCRDKGTLLIEGDQIARLQLRFTSSTDYVVEVLCSQYSLDPVVLDSASLPMFVTKKAGNSGIIWGDFKSGVVLEVFGREKAIGLENGQIQSLRDESGLDIGPESVCAGYGYTCCQADSQQGDGSQLEGVLDCPRSCFSSCVSRPVVLAFNTQPAMNRENRTIIVSPGEELLFSYTLSLGQAEAVGVRVDLGDGTVLSFDQPEQEFSHVYSCGRAECEYQVKLTAIDDQAISAALLPINQITVIVRSGG